jgi:Putative peptidoglycan binding domain
VSYDYAKRGGSGGGGGGNAVAAQSGTVGKSTLVDQMYGGEYDASLQHGEHDTAAPTEAPKSGPLGAPRFMADADLLAVATGKKALTAGATGMAVTKVQRALIELGQPLTASGKLDAATGTALKTFQKSKSITESGIVDKATMLALDAAFTGYSAEARVLAGMKPPSMATEGVPYPVGKAPKELLAGTHVPTAAEKAAVDDALSTEVKADPITGKLPTFVEVVGGKKYGDRIEAAVNAGIDWLLVSAKADDAARKAGHLYSWSDIENVGVKSKEATDATFGNYARGHALKATGIDAKIKDAWEYKEALLKKPAEADAAADWRVDKLLTGEDTISAIDREHGAIQVRAPEKAIIDVVRTKIVGKRKADLLLIHKDWPGFQAKDKIYIQRIEQTDASGKVDKPTGRDYMWQQFQTIIHEYLHTLEHPAHRTMRGPISAQKGGFVLREGTTDYFTKIAYNNTPLTQPLRQAVEGPFHEKSVTHAVGPLTTYREAANAERVAGIVGLPNLCGSFFLGQTELIGK